MSQDLVKQPSDGETGTETGQGTAEDAAEEACTHGNRENHPQRSGRRSSSFSSAVPVRRAHDLLLLSRSSACLSFQAPLWPAEATQQAY